jgi:hypothetical protein
MDMGMQHGQGHAALKGACSIGRGMQHGKGHAAWEGACSMDRGIQHGQYKVSSIFG